MNSKKNLLLTLALIASVGLFSQGSSVSCRYYSIMSTGAKVLMPTNEDPKFEVTDSEDGSKVYTGEISKDDVNYAVIYVEFKETVLSTTDEKTDMLTSYLDFLQKQFGITESDGYRKGYMLNENSNIPGIRDTWTDAEGLTYEVGGWVSSSKLAVILNYSSKDVSFTDFNYMWNGFRFP